MEKKAILKIHIIFWIITSSISILNTFLYIDKSSYVPLFIGIFIRIFFHMITFYIFYLIISPKFFNKKGILFLVFFEIIYIIFFSYIVTYIYLYPYMYFYSIPNPIEYISKNLIKEQIFYTISGLTVFSILGTLSKVSLIFYGNKIRQKEIEKQNISNELAMLRAQINPHFLFNTLNNIKSLIQRLPSKAIFSVDKLTGIMHYMLYESSVDKVPLENEINHINNYLDLEKIRYSDPNFIDFKISGDYSKAFLPPLIFMPFVENAFKHGDKLKPAPGINIKLEVNETNILFEIKNYIKENYDNSSRNSGFGLSNIKRRLDLLFDKKYELDIKNENKVYIVKLNLNYI
jgi:two-component system, LytTR family, sensor kinase